MWKAFVKKGKQDCNVLLNLKFAKRQFDTIRLNSDNEYKQYILDHLCYITMIQLLAIV